MIGQNGEKKQTAVYNKTTCYGHDAFSMEERRNYDYDKFEKFLTWKIQPNLEVLCPAGSVPGKDWAEFDRPQPVLEVLSQILIWELQRQ